MAGGTRVGLDLLGEEHVETRRAAEQHLAAPSPVVGAEVELVALQSLARRELLEHPGARVEANQPLTAGEPQTPDTVRLDSVDHIAGESVAAGVTPETALSRAGLESRQTAARARPECAGGIDMERVDGVVGQRPGILGIMDETLEAAVARIETVQAATLGPHPHRPGRIFREGGDHVSAEA